MTDWCSWWFEWLYGYCCYSHDMGGSDLALWDCVRTSPIVEKVGIFLAGVWATIMLIGVTFGRPIYEWWKRRR